MKIFGQILVIFLTFFFAPSSFAYNHFYTNRLTGELLKWDNTQPIVYYLDPGDWGVRYTNQEAHDLLKEAFKIWQNVETGEVPEFEFGGYLPEDITIDNYQNYILKTNCFEEILDECELETYRNLQTMIIFDAGNDILDTEFCKISTCNAMAGPYVFGGNSIDPTSFLQGVMIFGNYTHLRPDELVSLFVHETGHLLGLGHTSLNQALLSEFTDFDKYLFLPIMEVSSDYSTSTSSSAGSTLNPDDIAAISVMYPKSNFSTSTATISGTIFNSDGTTPAQHVNVVARNVSDPLCMAYSFVSGRYCYPTGGSLTKTCIESNGDFILEGLQPGIYTIEVEEIDWDQSMNFTEDLAGDAEFWNEGDVADEDPYLRTEITVAAGEVVENVNIILNGNTSEERERYIPLNQFTIPEETSCVDSTIDYAELIGYDGGTTESSTPASGGCSLIVPKK